MWCACVQLRRRQGDDLKQEKVLDLEHKAARIRRSLEDDDSLHENNEDDMESVSTVDKPQHKLVRVGRCGQARVSG
jgi:hypothetical protein